MWLRGGQARGDGLQRGTGSREPTPVMQKTRRSPRRIEPEKPRYARGFSTSRPPYVHASIFCSSVSIA
jgi:hypothetical protein